MSLPAAVTLRRYGAPDLLAGYAGELAALPLNPDARRIRRNGAARLLATHPQLRAWMQRPTPARVADLKRTGAWPFLTWCFTEGHLVPDLDLLLAKAPGGLYRQWRVRHPGDVRRVAEVAQRFGWSANWTRDVSRGGLALLCLTTGKTLDQLTDGDFAAFAQALAEAPSAGHHTWVHNSARMFSLHQACYELRICQKPPRQARPGKATIAQRAQEISQPAIRRAALRYLTTIAATLRAATVDLRADSLIVFSEYLAAAHPQVTSLTQLTRSHIEEFLAYNHKRPWRGRVARDQPVSPVVSKRTVIDLRCFFDELALWDWAERPPRRLLFPTDVPRLDKPLPRALAPDTDRDLTAAIAQLTDPFARTGLTLLRGTGIRLGELLDLELDCVWDSASHGSWLKVPLGKLATERTVPLDAPTLAALDEWIAQRGPQRALPHPRLGRPADFLFTERGRRLTAYRLRRGLDDAAKAAGLRGRDGQALHPTPHQLRHTYATSLVNAGMSLQALMALLGHVSTEMTLRYASLAAPAIRTAYEEAISKARDRLTLTIAPAGQPFIPGRVEWLRAEMLKTRVAHGYCSRQLAAETCPYANICEQCDNYVTAPEFIPQLQAQLADVTALRDDAAERGWNTEVARHSRVIASIQNHLQRLERATKTGRNT
ncbi:MAG TPA: tyrosine-type recombinase/integrase [Streptosporangiaceae bacterium]|nr:tyrosine-type recombinase/integrase [Streptosporangiaceae bacterium]